MYNTWYYARKGKFKGFIDQFQLLFTFQKSVVYLEQETQGNERTFNAGVPERITKFEKVKVK